MNDLRLILKYGVFMLFVFFTTIIKAQDSKKSQYDEFYEAYDQASSFIITNPEKANKLFYKSYRLLESISRDSNNKDLPYRNSSLKQNVSSRLQNLEKAHEVVNSPTKYGKEVISKAYDTIIEILSWKADKDAEHKFSIDALSYAKSISDTVKIIDLSIKIADINTQSLNIVNAERHFNIAQHYLDYFKGDKIELQIQLFQRYASFKNTLEEPVMSLENSYNALKELSTSNSYYRKGISYNEIAFSYNGINQRDSALYYIDKAILAWKTADDKTNLSLAYLNKSVILRSFNDTNGVIENLKKSLSGSIKENVYWIAENSQTKLGEEYSKLKNYKQAYLYMDMWRFIDYFENKYKKFREKLIIEAEYERDQNLEKIEIQSEQITAIEKENEEFRWYWILGFVISIFLLIGLTVNLFNSRKIRRREEQLRIQKNTIDAQNKKLSVSLAQNEVLLKEVHHRVKNNLTILSGLFYLQERTIEKKEDKQFLKECNSRIQSMALVHQKLYNSNDMSKNIDFEEYCNDLINSLASSNQPVGKEISYRVEGNGVALSLDLTIPLAIMITELVTNSFKYAFDHQEKGEIGIVLKEKNKTLELEVYDTGIGLGNNFSFAHHRSLGMNLIDILSRQIFAEKRYVLSDKSSFFFIFRAD